MNLSDRERKLVEVLERQVQTTQRFRWFFLAMGVFLILVSVGTYLFFFASGRHGVLEQMEAHPMFYLGAIGAGVAFAWSFQGFKGNPQKELLIKLLRDRESGS
ncbi:hypothetical protein [Marinobacter salarius]|jgi:hypothetical protein|uniref:hypothetical protein n=1 Tax=Marinobacter salarius TaxID=1420917 RepID=UPI000F85A7B9|nr:hypothetical protein [Marinobacter salarius]AZR39520.1 hypothetical protein MTMN5_00037 [Marinobacter salarius]